jgi:hypothetical protein
VLVMWLCTDGVLSCLSSNNCAVTALGPGSYRLWDALPVIAEGKMSGVDTDESTGGVARDRAAGTAGLAA